MIDIQLASDLHLEFPEAASKMPPIPQNAPILCLLGDIGKVFDPNYEQFLMEQADRFQLVFVIAGNHEYYHSEVLEAKERIQQICDQHEHLVFLDKRSYVYSVPHTEKRIKFLGCTLWTNILPRDWRLMQQVMNDYRLIRIAERKLLEPRRITVQDTVQWHKEEVEWLKSEIDLSMDNPNETVCVLTHHSPIVKGTVLPSEDSISCGMASDVSHVMKPCVTFWGFGHTHRNANLNVATPYHTCTIVASNQLGYITHDEDTIIRYDPDRVFTIPDRSETMIQQSASCGIV